MASLAESGAGDEELPLPSIPYVCLYYSYRIIRAVDGLLSSVEMPANYDEDRFLRWSD